jgi:multidrug efflux pump subunit AcrB
MQSSVPYDTTPFVKISIEEVVTTLIEAMVLVFLVMYLFLQNLRATLIPTIAVPVVLLGTFGVLAAFGFSINTLTMFGMVLAIGLLVDDAIVVVENVERLMREEGSAPREATKRKSMGPRSPARWSASPWCCRRCSCRWPSSAAPPASSTASSPSPSSRPWCCRCWWR